MTSMYPLPRQLRVTDPIAGDGVTTVFGPFSFKIFDIVDVVVYRKDEGDTQYGIDENATAAKTTTAPYENFTITFPTPPAPATTFIVASQRLHQRSTDVTRGGTVDANELNKEFSKVGSILQELRRDLDGSVRMPPGQVLAPLTPELGKLLQWGPADQIENSSKSIDEIEALIAEILQMVGTPPLGEFALRPEMFGGAADSDGTPGSGTDNADAFDTMIDRAINLGGRVPIRLAGGIYRVSREIGRIDALKGLTIIGQGAAETYLYGDFIGAGDYILNLSNSAENSYSTRGHRLCGIGFLGNGGPGDPQGLGLENAFEHVVVDIDAPNIAGKVLCNSVIVVTRDNNSKFCLIRSQGGWLPSAVSISQSVRASFTAGSTTIALNESVITDDMVGATIFFSDGSASPLNRVWSAQIASLNAASPANSIEISVPAPATKNNVVFGVGLIGGSIEAGSNQLTLIGGVDIDERYIGMQVHVPFGSIKPDASNKKGLLSTRIAAVNGDVLTLQDSATADVVGQPIIFAPPGFLGSFEGEGSERQTNHSWWIDTHFEGFDGFGLIVNRAIYAKFFNLKVHGTGFFGPDWTRCLGSILLSEIKEIDIRNVQAAYGSLKKKIWIMGSRGVVNLDNIEVNHIYLNEPPIEAEEVTDEFCIVPGLIRPVSGLAGFGYRDFKLIKTPAAHNLEYGVAFTRDQRLRQITRNTPMFTPGVTAQYQRIIINDDSTYTFRPPGNFGRLHITSSAAQVDGEVQYRTSEAAQGVYAYLARDAGNMAVSTGVPLSGTTGADGKVTIGPDGNGNLQIENRRGFQIYIAFLVAPFGDG